MKKHTIRNRILHTNLSILFLTSLITLVVFNISIFWYFNETGTKQLRQIANHLAELTTKEKDFFKKDTPPLPPDNNNEEASLDERRKLSFFFKLDQTMRDSLSVLNADYMLLDDHYDLVDTFPSEYLTNYRGELERIKNYLDFSVIDPSSSKFTFTDQEIPYLAIVRSLTLEDKNYYLILYTDLSKIKELQLGISLILIFILAVSLLIASLFSIRSAKRIAQPFSSLNLHLRNMANRNFQTKLQEVLDDELNDFVGNINHLSEQLLEYDQKQQKFFQNVSHDLRTPLMSVSSYAESILYDVLPPKEAAATILEESKRMATLVDEILYLSSLDHQKEPEMETTDLFSLLQRVIRRISPLAKEKEVRIEWFSELPEVNIQGNEQLLERCFDNILTNCLSYTQDLITLSLQVRSGEVILRIHDNGPGFHNEEIHRIFERFYRGPHGHIGLGLAIAKEILTLHHFEIEARNENGAVFLLRMRQNRKH